MFRNVFFLPTKEEEKSFSTIFQKWIICLAFVDEVLGQALCVCVCVLDIFFSPHPTRLRALTRSGTLCKGDRYHSFIRVKISFVMRVDLLLVRVAQASLMFDVNKFPSFRLDPTSVSRWSLNLFKWNWFEDKKSVARPESEGKIRDNRNRRNRPEINQTRTQKKTGWGAERKSHNEPRRSMKEAKGRVKKIRPLVHSLVLI